MLHYHCTKFPVSRISVSRDLSWGTQIGPSSHTLTLIVLKMLRRRLHLKSTALLVFFLHIDVYFPYTDIFYYRLCLFLCPMSIWLLKSLKKLKIIAFHLITYLSCHKKCVVCFTSFQTHFLLIFRLSIQWQQHDLNAQPFGMYLTSFYHFSVIEDFKWFWMGRLCRNIHLILVFLKG